MRNTFKIIGLVSAIALGAVAVQSAIAGPGGMGMGRGGNGPMMMGGNAQGMMGGCNYSNKMGGRMGGFGPAVKMSMTFDQAWAEKTKADLGITQAQTSAWATYVTAIKDGIETMASFREGRDPATMRNLSQEDRLALRNSHMGTRLELAKEVDTAKTALVSQLSEEQKVKAATLLPTTQPAQFSRRFNRN